MDIVLTQAFHVRRLILKYKYMMVMHECHALELRIRMNVDDLRSFCSLLPLRRKLLCCPSE